MTIFKSNLVLLILLIVSVSSYAQQSEPEEVTVVSTHGPVKVRKNAKKIVVLDYSILENFYALDIPVAGVTNTVPDYLAEYRGDKYAKLGTLMKPDIQAIKEMKPDLIISGGRQSDYYDSLTTIAPTIVFAFDNDNFWKSFESNILTIASLYGKEGLAKTKLDLLQKKIEKVKERTKSDENKALFVLHVNDRFSPNGPKSRFGFGYDVLGLQASYNAPASMNAPRRQRTAAGSETTPSQISERPQLPSPAQINPDYLFIIDRGTAIQGSTPVLEELLTDEIKATKAYKNNKAFVLPGSIWYLAGSGLISVDKKITDIGTMLYGISF